MALLQRRREGRLRACQLSHNSDNGCQYTNFRYVARLADVGIMASVASVADSNGSSMAEPLNGAYRTEPIHRQTYPRDQVEYSVVELINWCNHRRLHSAIGGEPPAELRRQPLPLHQRPSANRRPVIRSSPNPV